MEPKGSVRVLEREHLVAGLFVKEAAPTAPTQIRTPILMVHGVSHGWWAYERWLAFFAASGWTCYAMSLRNHGESYTVPVKTYLQMTIENYVQDVLHVLRWMNRPAVLLGHSMGGLIVQKVAEREEARAMVLVASVGPGQLGPIRDPLPTEEPFMLSPEEARGLWFHRIEDETFGDVYERLVPESPSVMNDYSNGRIQVHSQAISCPILVVGAEHDRTVVHPYGRIADFYGCDSLFVPDAGHDLMLEPVGLDAAIRINHWLLTALPDEGMLITKHPDF
jgi:pimeloyl-ACP methyl ester carboxylesterase